MRFVELFGPKAMTSEFFVFVLTAFGWAEKFYENGNVVNCMYSLWVKYRLNLDWWCDQKNNNKIEFFVWVSSFKKLTCLSFRKCVGCHIEKCCRRSIRDVISPDEESNFFRIFILLSNYSPNFKAHLSKIKKLCAF